MRNLPVVVALLALGCPEYDIIRYEGVDVFTQNPAEEVDVLMVVDNSGSMQPYQERLGTNFDQFITYFIEANVNYHIGVVTTDIEVPTAGQIRGQVITPATDNPANVFNNIVNVGTTGSGMEMGLEAATMALTEPLVSTANLGFLRKDASLSIIFVSDEEDSSPEPVNDYINGFRDVKGQRARDIFNASALTVTDIDECTSQQAAWSSPGTRYVDVADQTQGIIGNLCSNDFESIVTELSLNTSRLRDTFYLSDWPDTTSITVMIEESEIPCETGEWSYAKLMLEEQERPAIVFDRTYMPPVSARITVRYDYGDGDPARFCTDEQPDTTEGEEARR